MSSMNKTPLLLGLGSVSIVSLIVGNGCCISHGNLGAQADDTGEPAAPYVVQFKEAQLGSKPKDRERFIEALNDHNVVFRHNVVIADPTCDATSLKNFNVVDNSDPCTNMGQQVTQRVGFKNKDHLREALKHLANQP
jgi:hypothetical protein